MQHFSSFCFLRPPFYEISSDGPCRLWSLAFRLHYSPKAKPSSIIFHCLSSAPVCVLPSWGPKSLPRPVISVSHLFFFSHVWPYPLLFFTETGAKNIRAHQIWQKKTGIIETQNCIQQCHTLLSLLKDRSSNHCITKECSSVFSIYPHLIGRPGTLNHNTTLFKLHNKTLAAVSNRICDLENSPHSSD